MLQTPIFLICRMLPKTLAKALQGRPWMTGMSEMTFRTSRRRPKSPKTRIRSNNSVVFDRQAAYKHRKPETHKILTCIKWLWYRLRVGTLSTESRFFSSKAKFEALNFKLKVCGKNILRSRTSQQPRVSKTEDSTAPAANIHHRPTTICLTQNLREIHSINWALRLNKMHFRPHLQPNASKQQSCPQLCSVHNASISSVWVCSKHALVPYNQPEY